MTRTTAKATPQLLQAEWVPFSGGELEGCRPRALCADCRTKLDKGAHTTLCFHCYRLEIERQRALKAAGELNTASEERFQCALPLERVNHARLARLKVERQQARSAQAKASPYVDRRRQAQINARHALSRLAEGLRSYRLTQEQKQAVVQARGANAPIPEAWLPFVSAR
jgi:hypothetical protein